MALLDRIMSLLGHKQQATASLAKERLQIILAHERATTHNEQSSPSWLPKLQDELVAVLLRYVNIDKNALKVNLQKRDNLELLEINVMLPDQMHNKTNVNKELE